MATNIMERVYALRACGEHYNGHIIPDHCYM